VDLSEILGAKIAVRQLLGRATHAPGWSDAKRPPLSRAGSFALQSKLTSYPLLSGFPLAFSIFFSASARSMTGSHLAWCWLATSPIRSI
jgi:hypothetical protein